MTYMTGTKPTTTDAVDFTAALLQMTLASEGIQCIVAPLFDGPQMQSFEISLGLGVRPGKIERLSGALAMAAGADVCRVSRTRGRLLIEIPKAPSDRKTLPASRLMDLEAPTSWHVPLGIATTGRPVWLNLADERTCHVIIGGTTRSGKSNLMKWLLVRLLGQNAPRELALLLMDPKGYELTAFRQSRHLVHPPEDRPLEIVKLLMWLHQEAVKRARSGVNRPRLLAVIDEVRELVDRSSDVKHLLASLAQVGAGLGVHLVASTQQPGSKALGDALPNFPARLLGRTASKTLSYGAAGRARSQAETLLGRGDMILLAEGGLMVRFQAPLVSNAELMTIPRWSNADDVPRLDLPTAVEMTVDVDPRGGWNRKEIDLDAVRLAVKRGATATDLNRELGIYYDRAVRLVEQFGGDE